MDGRGRFFYNSYPAKPSLNLIFTPHISTEPAGEWSWLWVVHGSHVRAFGCRVYGRIAGLVFDLNLTLPWSLYPVIAASLNYEPKSIGSSETPALRPQ
jgi:hypothetical protein